MGNRLKLILILIILTGCVEAGQPTKSFEMYHDINWVNVPDNIPLQHLKPFNLSPGSGIYWGKDKHSSMPSERATKSHVMSFPYGQQAYINIEHLPNRYDRSTVEEQLDTVRKLSAVLYWTKQQRPDIEIGIFAMTVEKLFAPLKVSPQEYIDRNKRFAALAIYADVIYLDMYTWWNNRHDKWTEALNSSAAQARKLDRKVIVFMWPHYQRSGQLMPGDEWRDQLDEAYELTDGIVIWDKKTCDWNVCADDTDQDNWWYQTLDFMDDNNL